MSSAAKIVKAACLWLALWPAGAGAQGAQSELRQLEREIGELKNQLEQAGAQRSAEQKALDVLEGEITELNGRIRDNRALQARTREEQARLAGERQSRAADAAVHLDNLGRLVRQGYMNGDRSTLVMLLNQQDPEEIDRMMVYNRRIAGYRSELLTDIRTRLAELAELDSELAVREQRLAQVEAELATQKQALDAKHAERRTLLASIDRDIATGNRRMTELRQDSERLRELIRRLPRPRPKPALAVPRRTPAPPRPKPAAPRPVPEPAPAATARTAPSTAPRGPVAGRFGAMRGRLPLPLNAPVGAAFGQPRSGGAMRWTGMVFRAPPGSEVRTVFSGQVIFADWFKGYGLLIIIDHGDGYMSLYSNNSSLERRVGDEVKTGDLIALSGLSGGFPDPGLYFEIRKDGEPADPMIWCRR